MSCESVTSWRVRETAQGYIDAIADSGQHIAVNKQDYHDPDFYAFLPSLNGKTVLDIGCGNYYMDQVLQTQYPDAKFFGLDYPTMFEAAKAQLLHPVCLVGGSANRLPFADNSIDFVFSSLLFHWLEEVDQTAQEMRRVMRPGAGFVVSVAHPDYFKAGEFEKEDGNSNYSFRRTRTTTEPQQFPVMLSKVIGPIMYYSRPIDVYRNMFEEAGFTNVALHEPLFTDRAKLQEYEHLHRYTKFPLHLFVTGSK